MASPGMSKERTHTLSFYVSRSFVIFVILSEHVSRFYLVLPVPPTCKYSSVFVDFLLTLR